MSIAFSPFVGSHRLWSFLVLPRTKCGPEHLPRSRDRRAPSRSGPHCARGLVAEATPNAQTTGWARHHSDEHLRSDGHMRVGGRQDRCPVAEFGDCDGEPQPANGSQARPGLPLRSTGNRCGPAVARLPDPPPYTRTRKAASGLSPQPTFSSSGDGT